MNSNQRRKYRREVERLISKDLAKVFARRLLIEKYTGPSGMHTLTRLQRVYLDNRLKDGSLIRDSRLELSTLSEISKEYVLSKLALYE